MGPTLGCTCRTCVSACLHIPGRFTPLEALRAIRAGLASDMMAVGYWIGRESLTALLPRSIPPIPVTDEYDTHSRHGSWDAIGKCVFLDVDRRCEIHDSGFKPAECRARAGMPKQVHHRVRQPAPVGHDCWRAGR